MRVLFFLGCQTMAVRNNRMKVRGITAVGFYFVIYQWPEKSSNSRQKKNKEKQLLGPHEME